MPRAPRPRTLAGATAVSRPGGRIGVVLCHGYTGTPQSLGEWPDVLADAGFAVECPLLPGHGVDWRAMAPTRWTDWYGAVDRAFRDLQTRCDDVFVMGLSMGGTLALRLAEEHGDAVRGIVVVNPSLTTTKRVAALAPALKYVVRSTKGPGNDVAKPGVVELAYDRHPLHAFDSLRSLWAVTRAGLGGITQPLLVFRSANDHVVEAVSTSILLERVASREATEVVLDDSFHVATLDHDAARIFAGSVDFVRRHASAATAGMEVSDAQ